MEIDEVFVKDNPGLCRCCLSEGCYKDLASNYAWMGDTEIYADMLLECFDISISQQVEGPNGLTRLICEVCITRLRDACNFKKQVVESENKFIDMIGRGEFRQKVYETSITKQEVTFEPDEAGTEPEYLHELDYTEPDEDDEVLANLATTSRPQETPKRSRGRPKKTTGKTTPSKTKVKAEKKKVVKEEGKKARGVRVRHLDSDKRTEISRRVLAKRRNIEYLIGYSNVTPFLWYKGRIRCFYCCEPIKDPALLREHTSQVHQFANIELVVHDRTSNNRNKDAAVKIDVKDVVCRLCDQRLDGLEQLIHHIIIAHDAQYDVNTTNCVLPFILDKTNPTCALCGMTFSFFEYLLRHANKNHLLHNYMCDICGTSFQGENHLKMHHRYYHKEGGYPCDSCDLTFSTLSKKIQHQKNVHLMNLSKCPHCEDTFKSPYFKRVHMANVHGVEELKIKCPHCPKVYPQESIMSRHMRRVHLKQKNVECDVCGDKFFGPYDLKLHMTKHNGEKRHVCNFCGLKFSQRRNLTSHIADQHGPFRCLCGIEFADKDALADHTLTHIDGETQQVEAPDEDLGPFVCSVCGIEFVERELLADHMAEHEDGLLHVEKQEHENMQSELLITEHDLFLFCDLCKTAFADKEDLRAHLEMQHPGYEIVEQEEVLQDVGQIVMLRDGATEFVIQDAQEE